jgi:hypothetical protein
MTNPPTLQKETPIVDANGKPTQYFINYLLQLVAWIKSL